LSGPRAFALGSTLVILIPFAIAQAEPAVWTPGGTVLAGPLAAGGSAVVSVVSDHRGGVFGLWSDLAGTDVMHGGRLLIDGSQPAGWPVTGRTLLAPSQPAGLPVGAPDGDGGLYAATSYALTGPTALVRPFFVTRVDANGAPLPGWSVGGTPVVNTARPKIGQRMVSDGAHGVYLAWLDAIDATIRGDAYAGIHEVRVVRFDPGGGLAPGWPDSGVRVTVAPPTAVVSSDLQLALARDATDGVYVAWVDSTDGVGDLYVQHLDGGGHVIAGWPDGGRRVASAPARRQLGAITSDGTGGLLIGWTEYGSEIAAFVTRLEASGSVATGWSSDGVRLCPSCAGAGTEAIAADGIGGVHAVVGKVIDSNAENLYAYHVLTGGALDPAVAEDGGVVVSGPGAWQAVGATPDGAHGAFVEWLAPDHMTLSAIRLASDETPATGWSAGGVALNDGAAVVGSRGLIGDGSGSMLAWWQEEDSLLVTRLGPDGNPNTGVGGRPADPPGLMLAPNPSVAGAQVSFSLPAEADVTVEVFDVRGRRVRALADTRMNAGPHRLVWDGASADGSVTAAGVYLVRVRGTGIDLISKLVKLR
ncbi:MAG TPA: FlgD immunoglobulin-like domain containing protein, partial [Dongiaceae bacterium]|nr:FlgD immunoglobulin-like domain containing protein [Dongiaceae bacterium]